MTRVIAVAGVARVGCMTRFIGVASVAAGVRCMTRHHRIILAIWPWCGDDRRSGCGPDCLLIGHYRCAPRHALPFPDGHGEAEANFFRGRWYSGRPR